MMHMLEDVPNQVHTIYGVQTAVCVYTRGKDDNHLCFIPLIEDDENWYVSKNGLSTFWLNDFCKVMRETDSWLKRNAFSGKWGWELPSGGLHDNPSLVHVGGQK